MRLSYTGIIGGKALIKFSILLNSENSQKSVQIWSNFAQKVRFFSILDGRRGLERGLFISVLPFVK